MNREEMIELLKKHKEREASLKLKYKERGDLLIKKHNIEKHTEIETKITSSMEINADIRSKNKKSDKVGEAVINSIQKSEAKIKEIENKIEEIEIEMLESLIQEVKIRLEALSSKERELLTAYYIDAKTYDEIGNILYFELYKQTRSGESIKKIVEKALEKMIKL